ncbi:hypothetical protein, partial [Bartonella sp. AD328YNZD]|uniref:hypothetical protein n=1 Tax=Bartonella sp. AD328YNZD TaxID=3243464 RepID=UPI0035CFB16A
MNLKKIQQNYCISLISKSYYFYSLRKGKSIINASSSKENVLPKVSNNRDFAFQKDVTVFFETQMFP